MAIEAPISKFKKNNIKIFIVILALMAIWFAYDGYFNEEFINEHTKDDGPDSSLVFNKKAPPFMAGGAVLLAVYLFTIGGKKIVADENELVISDTRKIAYDTIEKIDKTHFEDKGYFVVTYNNRMPCVGAAAVPDNYVTVFG